MGHPSKRMLSILIRAGAQVTERDCNGDTPLSAFLKTLVAQPLPSWVIDDSCADKIICSTIWYLWSRDIDIHRKNTSGKSVASYLTALRLYDGGYPIKKNVAREIQRRIQIVPAVDGRSETLQFIR